MFESILIANRGEIARRIIRTCQRLGIRSVAVYSSIDRDEPFVREADEAIEIGAPPARDSYLRIERIIQAAQQGVAQAIHPGYGFLSENPQFARACEAAGITFIGPPADVIEIMGSKIAAKRLAAAIGVPIIPGFEGDDGSNEKLLLAAMSVGFPLLTKASAGGGGKGIRRVDSAGELEHAIRTARLEAKAAFDDDRLLLERLIVRARHVEVQIAADQFGGVVHLFERDCSVQRKNQKVFEEAPAPNLPIPIRARLTADATRLAASMRYRNLGTVEFLLDVDTEEHFFLETNTRLQVEHPVTEAITGLDLVEWQLRIAAGEHLPLMQNQISSRGHAIEARLTAERPEADYQPATGRLVFWQPPPPSQGLRIDSSVETGSEVSVYYDSMIAKVIAHGANREDARRKLVHALDQLIVMGLVTNRAFLLDVAKRRSFADGTATTAALGEWFAHGWSRAAVGSAQAAAIAAAATLFITQRPRIEAATSPWQSLAGFRLLGPAGRPVTYSFMVELGENVIESRVQLHNGVLTLASAGAIPIKFWHVEEHLRFRLADSSVEGIACVQDRHVHLRYGPNEFSARVLSPLESYAEQKDGDRGDTNVVVATMPGIIAELTVAPGQEVLEGESVLTLESMKLFMTHRAPRSGQVLNILVKAGDSVTTGMRLLELVPVDRGSRKGPH